MGTSPAIPARPHARRHARIVAAHEPRNQNPGGTLCRRRLFAELGAMAASRSRLNGMLKKTPSHPPGPARAETRHFPELRSRFEKILNVPYGKKRVLARVGWAGEVRYASGFSSLRPRFGKRRALAAWGRWGVIKLFLSIPYLSFFTRRICER